MRILTVRWLLLPAAVFSLLSLFVRGYEHGSAAAFVLCAAGWYALSRRKARSLDRERLGLLSERK